MKPGRLHLTPPITSIIIQKVGEARGFSIALIELETIINLYNQFPTV